MEKYNTYEIWENKETHEIKRKKIDEKLDDNWIRRYDLEEDEVNPPHHTK